MKIPMYQVDAFASRPFAGNPAAVCVLDEWLEDGVLQDIASENNLAETAFIIKNADEYSLRWFTPTVEIDLCGHATLASAYVIFEFLEPTRREVIFNTMSGKLAVADDEGMVRQKL
jgi:PhzF family phenazine biosynthesis protein